jgi:hypothetical protein
MAQYIFSQNERQNVHIADMNKAVCKVVKETSFENTFIENWVTLSLIWSALIRVSNIIKVWYALRTETLLHF